MNRQPSILISFAHLKERHVPLQGAGFDQWVLDSGAYTAHNSGKTVNNSDFISFALRAQQKDERLVAVFALDVIGDPKASLDNALAAQRAGVQVIPTWHAGEPIEFAVEMAKQFPRVALGGLVARLANNRAQLMGTSEKLHYAEKFFHAVWPKWVHGFGCTAEELMANLPFAAVDSTTWCLRPSMYGSWKTFGKLPVRVSGDVKSALKAEVDWFLDRESFHNAQWRKQLASIDCEKFRIRFACSPTNVKDISAMFAPGEVLPAIEDEQTPELTLNTSKPKQQTKPAPEQKGFDPKWENYWKERLI